MKKKENIIILGGGVAGLGAAYHFREKSIKSIIFDKKNYYGGKTASFTKDGFTFDRGPHISFSKDKKIKELFAKNVNNKYLSLDAGANNFWKGYWIKHPAQVNLHGLPVDLVTTILMEFIETNNINDNKEIKTFKEWLYASFGKTFAETFPMKYGVKFHTTSAENMSTDWLGPRLYKPKMDEVIHGALSKETKDVHYISDFRYPEKGGFVSFLKKFIKDSEIKLDHNLLEIDNELKSLTFENGKVYEYDYLISSIPLPHLIPKIKNIPKNVLKAANELTCSKCVLVNVGIDRDDISETVWSYFYDEEIIFSRVNFPHMQSPNNVPENCGSIQVEIYFSDKYKPLNQQPEEFIERTIMDLKKCGLIKESDKLLYKDAQFIEFANVIFDLDTKKNLKIVHEYLDSVNIKYCGRYGEWAYIWTDQSFRSGMSAAKKVIRDMNK